MKKQVIFGMEKNKLKDLKHRLIDKGLSLTEYLNQLIEKDRIADNLDKATSLDSVIDEYERIKGLMEEKEEGENENR